MEEHLLDPEDDRDPDDVRIGATIRALTEAHGWRVGELAVALGLSHSYVSNVMSGRKRATPQFCRLTAHLLHVPLAAIISGQEHARAAAVAGSEATS